MALEIRSTNNRTEMQRVFNLPKMPERIEVYDNSHIQGSYAVGGNDRWRLRKVLTKKAYRTFNIKIRRLPTTIFAMMREVLGAVFAKMTPENR